MNIQQLQRPGNSANDKATGQPHKSLPSIRTVLVLFVLIAFSMVLALFFLFEVVERVWLTELDMDTLHVLHRIRGLGVALVALALLGWFVLRWSHPLLESALSSEEWASGIRPSKRERNTVYSRWFILMRWIAILVATTVIVVTVEIAELLPQVVLWPLLVTVALLAGLNLVYMMLLRPGGTSHRLLSFQAYADLVLLTVLLHYSGSLENPLAPLMLFHVIIAGIILSRRQCFMVAAFACTLFALLAGLELEDFLPHYTLDVFPHQARDGEVMHAAKSPLYVTSHVVLHSAILLLTALFVTTLAERLRRDERQLEQFADRILSERQLLEQALETTNTGLCMFDRNMDLLWQNQQWVTWFGRASADSLFYEQICGPDSDTRKTIQDGQVRVAEISLDPPTRSSTAGDHDVRTYQATTAPQVDQDNEITGVVQLVHDITEQKRTQASLVRAGKLAAVGEMAGEVAHEVNNPIAIISAKTRLLLANHRVEISEKIAEELTKITDMADRVARIVQGLLSYSRPSAGLRKPMDIRTPIRKTLELVEQRAQSSGVRIETHLPDSHLLVVANADEMEQVFLNLLINSMDATKDGGRLTVSAVLVANESDCEPVCEIVIEDTGTGIALEIQSRIFEPFFTTKAEGEGSGLGLSICLGLIQSHGGSIELTSEPGQGTRVTVRLPVDVSDTKVHQYG